MAKTFARLPLGTQCKIFSAAFAIILPFVSAAPAKEAPNIARDILQVEQELLGFSTDVYSRMESTVDAAVAAVTKAGLATDPSGKIDPATALRILETVDQVLVSRNFIYPGTGLVEYLADGLTPRKLTATQFYDAVEQVHNARRRPFMEANRDGEFYVVDCDTAAFLFLTVADRLQLPLYLVEVPGHNFVRWEFADGSHLNFETMDGDERSDAHYRQGWGVPDDTVKAGFFMTSMSPDEVLGYVTAVRGGGWERKQEVDRARADYHVSVMLRPKSPAARNALAWSYATCATASCRDGATAVKLATEAVALWRTSNFLDTLACAYGASGNFEEAVRQEQEALKIGYGYALEYNLGRLQVGELCPFAPPPQPIWGAAVTSLQPYPALYPSQQYLPGKFAGND